MTGQPVPKRLRTDGFQIQQDASDAASKQPPKTIIKTAVKPASKPQVVAPQTAVAKESNPVGSEPSIDTINTMSYNDIRKELKLRGISCAGKKTELVERLLNAIKKEKAREETLRKKEMLKMTKSSEMDTTSEKKVEDVVMDDATIKAEDEVQVVKDTTIKIQVDETTTVQIMEKPVSKPSPAPKSALKPSKYAMALAAKASARAASPAKKFKPAPKPELPMVQESPKLPPEETTKISSGSESSNSNLSMTKSSVVKPTSSTTQTTPSFKSTTGKGGEKSAKAEEKKKNVSALKESRAAKMAEMRERVRHGMRCGEVFCLQLNLIIST